MNKKDSMSIHSFAKYMNDLVFSICNDNNVKCIYDKQMDAGTCKIDEINRFVVIGVKDLSLLHMNIDDMGKLKSDFTCFDKVKKSLAVSYTVNLFHEINHLMQYTYDIQDNKDLAYNDICTYPEARDSYYLCLSNYFHNPREISAEYNGVADALDYLKVRFKNANALICNYVNGRVNNKYYWINKTVNNFDDITNSFVESLEYSSHHKRICAKNDYWSKNDKLMDFFDDYPAFKDKFDAEDNPIKQDKMIASIVLHYRPIVQDNYECLHDEDMSISTVFEIPFRPLPVEFEDMVEQSKISTDLGDINYE